MIHGINGIYIGDYTIVGASSVVRHSFPDGPQVAPGSRIGPLTVNWLEDRIERVTVRPTDFRSLSIEQLERTSIPYQLHSEDRNSMRWSVESRLPFMDHELVEYVLGLPTEYKVGRGYQKRILRDAVPELPEHIATRKSKIGFAAPDAAALKGNEQAVRAQIEEAVTLVEAIDRRAVLSAYDTMIADGGWYDPLFFRLCSAAAWHRSLRSVPRRAPAGPILVH